MPDREGPMERRQIRLTPEEVRAIESVLSREDRVEVIPVRDGVKIVHIRRETVKTQR